MVKYWQNSGLDMIGITQWCFLFGEFDAKVRYISRNQPAQHAYGTKFKGQSEPSKTIE